MSKRFNTEQIKAFEREFTGFLENKDDILYNIHEALNKILADLPQSGIFSYTNDSGLVRGELTGEDGTVFYTWYTTEDILGYSIAGAMNGMFGTSDRIRQWAMGIAMGLDIRESFIDMVNTSIDIILEVSEEWDLCIQ